VSFSKTPNTPQVIQTIPPSCHKESTKFSYITKYGDKHEMGYAIALYVT